MPGNLKPMQLGPNDWFYEENDHLLLVHEVREADGKYIRTDQIKIPWRRIEASLKRVRQPA
jgi:hypothetical protein